MDSNLKKSLLMAALIGAAVIPGEKAKASDINQKSEVMPSVGIESVLDNCYASEKEIAVENYLVPSMKGEYLDMAFTNVGTDTFLFIRSEPTKESEWVGKLYTDNAAQIMGPVGEWTKIQSGSVTGYVFTEYITIGKSADQKAHQIISGAEVSVGEEAFQYAESREEEALRIQKEAEEAAASAAAANVVPNAQAQAVSAQPTSTGQAVVDYACQFIGNPYVWGGTSLTNGADCSGFVQSVFANFGVSLPRTTWDQENVGVWVSYDQAIPGDLILYEGHVGIYMGNGQIVNAINPQQGIGIIPATSMGIKTVRRVL